MAIASPTQQQPAVTTEPVVATDADQIVANGQTVQVASPDKLNPIDLAADGGTPDAGKAAAANAPAPSTPAVHALLVKPAASDAQPSAPVGSASWIAHVLAALGGAIAAGAVAWFLIGPSPARNYG